MIYLMITVKYLLIFLVEKPIKANKFTECIAKHFKINRPDLDLQDVNHDYEIRKL